MHRRHILLLLGYIFFLWVVSISLNINWYVILRQMQVFEFFVLAIATYRLTRLFVHDQIMEFVRESFYEKRETVDVETGEVMIAYIVPTMGARLLGYELFARESYVVIWAATFVTLAYIIFPVMTLFILIFAIAGLVSLGQTLLEKAGQ
ncbi:MAG: DUF1360 domain-containing protein [Candidatus Magasanikbacteria bacterium]|nr:DUF1360 domain-containing protein [Candidatus Magasanikbacteria bacterium]